MPSADRERLRVKTRFSLVVATLAFASGRHVVVRSGRQWPPCRHRAPLRAHSAVALCERCRRNHEKGGRHGRAAKRFPFVRDIGGNCSLCGGRVRAGADTREWANRQRWPNRHSGFLRHLESPIFSRLRTAGIRPWSGDESVAAARWTAKGRGRSQAARRRFISCSIASQRRPSSHTPAPRPGTPAADPRLLLAVFRRRGAWSSCPAATRWRTPTDSGSARFTVGLRRTLRNRLAIPPWTRHGAWRRTSRVFRNC